jgi:hypothetical protein
VVNYGRRHPNTSLIYVLIHEEIRCVLEQVLDDNLALDLLILVFDHSCC